MSGPLTIGSLFAGIGGFDLAAEAMGWRTAWFVEWDASCQHWLGVNFPGVPIHGDITKVDFKELEPVDLLCGGFPCQPASAAGKRLGTADDRWLWPEFARAIGEIRPRYVVAENVPGLLSVNGGRAFAEVLRDLAALGYDAEWDRLSAGDVGSPQERERVWIVAYAGRRGIQREQRSGTNSSQTGAREGTAAERERVRLDGGTSGDVVGDSTSGECLSLGDTEGQRPGETRELRPDRPENGACGRSEDVGDSTSGGREARRSDGVGDEHGARRHEGLASRPRCEVRPWTDAVPVRGADGTVRLIPKEAAEQGPESPLWPVATGVSGRVARLRAIGNAVVPQCVLEGPFQVIQELESQRGAA